jgi:hypothetical protein
MGAVLAQEESSLGTRISPEQNFFIDKPEDSKKNSAHPIYHRDRKPSPIPVDPKTALPSRSCAVARLRRTFAVQLRVLARILFHDGEIPVRARYAKKNVLIVPFFLNSPDFWCTAVFGFFQIAL